MPVRALLIEVHLLDGRYHGAGDWPPAPFRLFQALVAGAYGGRWRAEPDDAKDEAFRWLENLAPPHIAAPPKIVARATTYFVPNNDIDAVDGDLRRVSEIRSGKLVRAILLAADAPCVYAWPFDEGEGYAHKMRGFADRVHTLGAGIDAAFARAEVCEWREAELRLADHPGSVCRPGKPGDPRTDPPCPVPGSLDSLKRRHAAGVTRFIVRRDGRTSVTLFNQPPKAMTRAISYVRPTARLLFELRSAADSTAFDPTPQEQACKIAVAVRNIAAARLKNMMPHRGAEIDRLVVGQAAGAADIPRRIRIMPLPSIGHAQSSPSIRRVAVEIPPDCPLSQNELSVALANQTVDRIDDATGEVIEDGAILIPADDDTMLAHYGLGDRGSRRWQTVTPVVLPERKQKGRVRGSDRLAANNRASVAVAVALRHAGVDWRGVVVRVQTEPFRRKGARADAFNADRFGGRLQHVEIIFPKPVSGPLVVGDGRWLGLGVMAPVREGPPTVHLFAIDPAEAPPLSEREKITRALRNAVMVRVDPEWRGNRRDRRDGPLPLFFTGHDPDGEPARSGQHEHLFFLADDADGDGRIDQLAVIAPHLADRKLRYDAGHRSAMRDQLQVLDRALDGFTILRAGPAGAPRLARIAEPDDDDDPLFGRAKSWVSRTLYCPTHHPKVKNIKEATAADLIVECARRGLPRPEVEIVETRAGPRGGLTARTRLLFKTAVEGPLLLGRGSHFEMGLFARSA